MKNYKKFILIFFSLLTFSFNLFSKNTSEEILENMSLDEKIGQLFMVPLCPKRDCHHFDDIQKLIDNYYIGGIIIKQANPKEQIDTLNYFQGQSKYPLLVSADAEWGLGMRMNETISYPKNIYLGLIEDDNLIFELGKEIARQLKLVGVHINLAPVVDINNNPKNQVIKERVFGSDSKLVTKKAKLIVLGMQSQNILCTAKHFPGYGDIEIDPHLDLPKAYHSLDRLKNIEFIPYNELIENNIACIMTAHILLPNLDYLPVTMSKKLTEDLLRNVLNFKGLIITDALNMKALTNIYSIEHIALQSHIAGNDILLYGDHINPNIDDILNRQVPIAFDAIKQAYLSGQLDIKKLNEHVLKILKAKEKLNLFENRFVEKFDDKKINSEYAYKLKERLENEIKKYSDLE